MTDAELIDRVKPFATDYAKIRWLRQQHHRRFRSRVENQLPRLVCQECGGSGGHIEVLFDGQGPFEQCGLCEGTGLLTPWLRGLWLRWKRESIRRTAIKGTWKQ